MKSNLELNLELKKICGRILRASAPIAILGSLAAAQLIGCAKSTEEEPRVGSFNYVYTKTLKTACIECHTPTGAPSGTGAQLDVTTRELAYSTLLTKTVTGLASGGASGSCGTVKLVTPSVPTSSYLAAVLIQSYNVANFGGASGCQPYNVHLLDQNLSDTEKQALITWIQEGAQNND